MTCLFVFTAAKSLLNKKSDGGVKVGIPPVPWPEADFSIPASSPGLDSLGF